MFIGMVQKPNIATAIVPDPPANVVIAEPKVDTQQENAQPKPLEKQPLFPYTM